MGESSLRDLRNAYRKAVKHQKDTFKVDDYEFVTGFAKYLIEYLEMIGIKEETKLCSLIQNCPNK